MGLLRREGVAAAAIKVGGPQEDTAALLRATAKERDELLSKEGSLKKSAF